MLIGASALLDGGLRRALSGRLSALGRAVLGGTMADPADESNDGGSSAIGSDKLT